LEGNSVFTENLLSVFPLFPPYAPTIQVYLSKVVYFALENISRWFFPWLLNNPEDFTPFDTWSASGDACHKISTRQQWAREVCSDIEGPESTKHEIQSVVECFAEEGLFTKSPGTVPNVEHTIDTGTHSPHRDKVRPMSAEKTRILDEQIRQLKSYDIIEACESPWRCNPVLTKKKGKNGAPNYRLCIDYRSLNDKAKPIPHAMPRIDWVLAQLGQAKVFTTIDLCHVVQIKWFAQRKYFSFIILYYRKFFYNIILCFKKCSYRAR
jgi:hypothetical protein